MINGRDFYIKYNKGGFHKNEVYNYNYEPKKNLFKKSYLKP